MQEQLFADFVGDTVKVPYKDGEQIKIARGILVSSNDHFVKIVGKLGTIIINTKNVEKMSRARDSAVQV